MKKTCIISEYENNILSQLIFVGRVRVHSNDCHSK